MKTLEGTQFHFGTSCKEFSEPHGMTVRYFTDRNGILSAQPHTCEILEAGIIDHHNFGRCVRITVKDEVHGVTSWMRTVSKESADMLSKLYETFGVESEEEIIGRDAYCHFGFYTTLLTIVDPESYAGLILSYNVVELK